jgi:ELWxxDGT repeat protein
MKILRLLTLFFSVGNVFTYSAQTLTLIKDINPSGSSNPHFLLPFNNKIYFVANPGTGDKIYSSDGTSSGTQLVGPSVGSGNLYPIISYNNTFFFNYDDGINGAELWKSDGTTAGTVLIKDIIPGSSGSNPQYLAGANGKVFFISGTKLWTSDGTNAGTLQLTENTMIAESFNHQLALPSYNNAVYFAGNNGNPGLWKSDGSVAGTQLLKNIGVNAYLENVAIYNNEMYFAAGDNTNGYELWKTNGTAVGTVLVKNINAGSDSNPTRFLISNNKIFFLANDGTSGEELWISDGTSAGTQLVKNIMPGTSSSNIQTLIAFNNQVYFFALSGSNRLLYKTDGTSAATILVKTIPYNVVPYAYVSNDKLYFLAKSLASTYLFESDGTEAGTKQITPSISSENYSDINFLNYNSELYLPCYNGNSGVELNKLTFDSLSAFSTEKSGFEIYPNPVTDVVWIQNEGLQKNWNYQLLDLSGRVFQEGKLTSDKISVSVRNYSPGIYILRLQSDTEYKDFKILKK